MTVQTQSALFESNQCEVTVGEYANTPQHDCRNNDTMAMVIVIMCERAFARLLLVAAIRWGCATSLKEVGGRL